ncbi:YncE family protein [Marinicellulosiphila megalodicopiae]|uniref:YncE family protein n=1 Tax=Marinicellulosiphila megalodicopiae TaxID=2724896 RepID=UPI003BB0975D
MKSVFVFLIPFIAIMTFIGCSEIGNDNAGNVLAEQDVKADFFQFTDANDVQPTQLIESNEVVVTGISGNVAVSVIGGKYSINGSNYTNNNGYINNNDSIKVRGVSSDLYGVSNNVELSIVNAFYNFKITTKQVPVIGVEDVNYESNNEISTSITAYKDEVYNDLTFVISENIVDVDHFEFSVSFEDQEIIADQSINIIDNGHSKKISFTPSSVGQTVLTGLLVNTLTNESLITTLTVNVVELQIKANLFAASNSRDMVHNPANNTLYITDGSDVLHYDLLSGQLLERISVGGNLIGIDINQNNSQLVVADGTRFENTSSRFDDEVNLYFIEIDSHVVSSMVIDAEFGESGSYSVLYLPDNKIMFTTDYAGSGGVLVRIVDLGSDAVLYERSIEQRTMLNANNDRSIIVLSESNSSAGPFGIYNIETNLTKRGRTDSFLYDISIDRNNEFVAIPSIMSLKIFDNIGNLIIRIDSENYGIPLGVAYSPVSDLLFVPWADKSSIGIFNSITNEFVENISIPHIMNWHNNKGMNDGRIKISKDGSLGFVQVVGGIHSFIIQ